MHRAGLRFISIAFLLALPQSIMASTDVCASLADIKGRSEVAFKACEANVQLWHDQYEDAKRSAVQRLGNPDIVIEQDRHFQSRLKSCTTSECVRIAYVDQNRELSLLRRDKKVAGAGPKDLTPSKAPPAISGSGPQPSTPSGSASMRDLRAPEDLGRPIESNPTGLEPVERDGTNPSARQQTIGDQVLMLLIWGIALGSIAVLVMAATNRVVFYFDTSDALWSIAPGVLVAVGLMIISSIAPDDVQQFASTPLEKIIFALVMLGATSSIAVNYRNAIYYNKSIALGILIGTLKLCVSVLMAITLVGQISRIMNSGSSRKETNAALLLLATVALLWVVLVNGRRVYEARGWPLQIAVSAS